MNLADYPDTGGTPTPTAAEAQRAADLARDALLDLVAERVAMASRDGRVWRPLARWRRYRDEARDIAEAEDPTVPSASSARARSRAAGSRAR